MHHTPFCVYDPGVARLRKTPKKIKVELARHRRARGMSYAEIGREMGVSPSGVYFALNPRKRQERKGGANGKPRSVYLTDDVWERLREVAEAEGTSSSKLVAAIVTGAHVPIALEPLIPGVPAEDVGL